MIKTERLTLRPFREGDAADVFEYLSGPQPHCFACMKVRTMEEARGAAAERVKHREYCLAIELEGRVIGEIEAHPESSQPDKAENYTEDTFSPCWMLHPDFQGRGYAFEAAKAFFDYLFREKGARRIYAYTEDNNLPSQKLCQRLGMRQEGLFREFVTFVSDADGNPIYENTIQWAILKWEWEKQEAPTHLIDLPKELTASVDLKMEDI